MKCCMEGGLFFCTVCNASNYMIQGQVQCFYLKSQSIHHPSSISSTCVYLEIALGYTLKRKRNLYIYHGGNTQVICAQNLKSCNWFFECLYIYFCSLIRFNIVTSSLKLLEDEKNAILLKFQIPNKHYTLIK